MNTDISKRVRSIAEALGLPDLILDEDGQALIAIEGAYLHIQAIEEEEIQVLVLVADLGEIAVSASPDIYRAMLMGNLSWREVGGGALALDPDGKRALLIVRLDLVTLDDAALAQRVYAAIDTAETWAAQLSAMQSKSEEYGETLTPETEHILPSQWDYA